MADDRRRANVFRCSIGVKDPVISVRGLRKSYGALEAMRGIDLEVARGEIFAWRDTNREAVAGLMDGVTSGFISVGLPVRPR